MDIRREQRSGSGCRTESSRVLADPNIGEKKGGGLTDTRGRKRPDRSKVKMFQKVQPYQQSTKEIVQY